MIADHQDRFDAAIQQFGKNLELKRLAVEMSMAQTVHIAMEMGIKQHVDSGMNAFPDQRAVAVWLTENPDTTDMLENECQNGIWLC